MYLERIPRFAGLWSVFSAPSETEVAVGVDFLCQLAVGGGPSARFLSWIPTSRSK